MDRRDHRAQSRGWVYSRLPFGQQAKVLLLLRRVLGVAALVWLCCLPLRAFADDRPLCDMTYTRTWCGSCSEIPNGGYPFCDPTVSHGLVASYSCATGNAINPPGCNVSQCGANGFCWSSFDTDTRQTTCQTHAAPPNGPPVHETDYGANGVDDDYDGCVDNGITLGQGECTCTAACSPKPTTCPPMNQRPVATCDPYNPSQRTVCFNGRDSTCTGRVGAGCVVGADDCKGPDCKCPGGATAGADPVLLGSVSAVTEPFKDFSANDGVLSLGITRIYSSADASYFGDPPGIFGRGWHHDSEAWLSCNSTSCTVVFGTRRALRFKYGSDAPSLDGTEVWNIFNPYADKISADDNQSLLVRRPSGEWIMYSPDGRERHFASVCDACGNPANDAYCYDALVGGRARLVSVVDAKGNAVQLAYDRPNGTLLGLSDALGHQLTVRSSSACVDGLASSLVYDGTTVATYAYNGLDLANATDADGHVLRSYVYDLANTQRLLEVHNEGGDTIAAFAYDTQARAVGVIDRSSSVAVNYDSPGGPQVTEYFGGTSSTSVRTLDRDSAITSISADCACGPARTFAWTKRRMTCSADTLGHLIWQDYDTQGRLTHSREYSSTQGCPVSAPTTQDYYGSREEWRSYGLVRTIAQGVTLNLDAVSSVTRWSSLKVNYKVGVTYDHDPTPQSIDPSGYACQQAPLPTGSVVCRQIETGYVYNSSGTVVSERHATFYSYDARGRLIRQQGPINLDYPPAGEVIPVVERTYWPDTDTLARRGRLHEVKRYPSPTAAPLVTSFDYDVFGPYLIEQPDGGTTLVIKDARGRPVTIVAPDGGQTERRYHDGSDPRLVLTPTGTAVRYTYDALGRPASIEHLSSDPEAPGPAPTLGWGEYYTYDPAGNRTHAERRDGNGLVTWQQDRVYDVQHRLVSETNPESPATARTLTFDSSGFLAAIVDEQGRATTFVPDALNRITKITQSGTDANNNPVSLTVGTYVYPAYADAPATVTNGNGQNTTYKYDDFGRLASMGVAIGSFGPKFQYDTRGNVLQKSSGYYSKIIYAYDGLDRLTSLGASNTFTGFSTSYTYRYDQGSPGRLIAIVETDRTTSYAYDPVGRLNSETIQENGVSLPLVTSYDYDLDGAISEIDYPSGLHVLFARDPATREITQVKNVADGTVYAGAVQHLPGGPASSLTFGNGLGMTQSLNRRYEPNTITSGPLALVYTMSPAGDVGSILEGSTARSFQYDFLDRLTGSLGWLSYVVSFR